MNSNVKLFLNFIESKIKNIQFEIESFVKEIINYNIEYNYSITNKSQFKQLEKIDNKVNNLTIQD